MNPTTPRIVTGQGQAEKPVEKEVLQSRITSISGDFTKEKSVWDLYEKQRILLYETNF